MKTGHFYFGEKRTFLNWVDRKQEQKTGTDVANTYPFSFCNLTNSCHHAIMQYVLYIQGGENAVSN